MNWEYNTNSASSCAYTYMFIFWSFAASLRTGKYHRASPHPSRAFLTSLGVGQGYFKPGYPNNAQHWASLGLRGLRGCVEVTTHDEYTPRSKGAGLLGWAVSTCWCSRSPMKRSRVAGGLGGGPLNAHHLLSSSGVCVAADTLSSDAREWAFGSFLHQDQLCRPKGL